MTWLPGIQICPVFRGYQLPSTVVVLEGPSCWVGRYFRPSRFHWRWSRSTDAWGWHRNRAAIKWKWLSIFRLHNKFKFGVIMLWYRNYSGYLKSAPVWILNGQKEIGLHTVRIWNGIWNLVAKPIEIRTNGCRFVKDHWKSRQKCLILNGLVFKWLPPLL